MDSTPSAQHPPGAIEILPRNWQIKPQHLVNHGYFAHAATMAPEFDPPGHRGTETGTGKPGPMYSRISVGYQS